MLVRKIVVIFQAEKFCKTKNYQWMEIILNEYHKKVNATKIAKVTFWKQHPKSREESLRKLRLLREQRLASQSNW